jgi:hypothetical protein
LVRARRKWSTGLNGEGLASEKVRKLEEIIRELHGPSLSVYYSAYAVLYVQCKLRFPKVSQELAKPAMFQSVASAPTQ